MDAVDIKKDFIAECPETPDLKKWAARRIPRFAFEYLSGGCNDDVNLLKNKTDIQDVELMPRYLSAFANSNLKVRLFGEGYDAPFGIAPIGLQGLIWPNSPEILARACERHNIPFILSTVTTCSIERAAELTNGRAWFQLYYPAENHVRDDLLKRAHSAGLPVLVALSDVPTFGFRPRDIRNGLAMPPKMTFRNMMQIVGRPKWAISTLLHGKPNFDVLKPYMPKGLNLRGLGQFMDDTFDGRLDEDKLSALRERWPGKLVVKGIVNEEDAEKAIRIGVDGIIVSNHGGRQLDAGQSTIKPLAHLAQKYGDKLTVMMDGGVRSGPDIARAVASGAAFVFMGRPFMYGVAALAKQGGNHTIAMFKMQLRQIMEQLCCENIGDLPSHLIHPEKEHSAKKEQPDI